MTMSGFVHAAAVGIGVIGLLWVLNAAVRTVVMPRPERVWLTDTVLEGARRVVRFIAGRVADADKRHRLLGGFGPAALLLLPVLWSVGVVISFAVIFWGLEVGSMADALELSGSSFTTLGFVAAPTFATRIIAIAEALLGLAVVALMISFLPTIYGTFSRREIAVGRFTTWAGEPPSPVEFIVRLDVIKQLDDVGRRWEEWQEWFVELGETHTSFPALVYFRSSRRQRSWLAAAEAALDTAAIITSTRLAPSTGQADVMIRSGYLALRAIADSFGIEPEVDSAGESTTAAEAFANDPFGRGSVSVDRAHFETIVNQLRAGGVPIDVDADEAWAAFRGWRINYDRAVTGLYDLVGDTRSHWELVTAGSNDADRR